MGAPAFERGPTGVALLDDGPRYGYQLKTAFEAVTGGAWPLNVGQVYTTLDRLAHLQLYIRGGVPHLVLLPAHVPERVPSRAVAPYTVAFPVGANYLPYELVDLLLRRVSGVGVEKLGTI